MLKRLFCILVLFLCTGCNQLLKPSTPPTNHENLSVVATQLAITPTATESLSTPEVNNINLETTVLFRENFDSEIDTTWTILNENKNNWGLKNKVGFLEINATSGYFNLGNAKNVFLLEAPDKDFSIETYLLFDPEASDQFAGLIVIGEGADFVQTGIGYCPKFMGCSGRGFYIDIYQDGKLVLPRNTIDVFDEPLSIRVEVIKNDLYVFTSADGASWFRIFKHQIEFVPKQVGLIAAQNNDLVPETAHFDYFEIRTFTQ